jgi:DNA-binding XRE family transcriptional regulator
VNKRILDLGLTQKGAAKHMGVHAKSVANCLKARRAPDLEHWPEVIRFLGYDPRPAPESIGAALIRWREGRGQSQEDLAAKLQVDPTTLTRWERDERTPTNDYLARVSAFLDRNRDA